MAPATEPPAEARPAAAATPASDDNGDAPKKMPVHARKSSLGDLAGCASAWGGMAVPVSAVTVFCGARHTGSAGQTATLSARACPSGWRACRSYWTSGWPSLEGTAQFTGGCVRSRVVQAGTTIPSTTASTWALRKQGYLPSEEVSAPGPSHKFCHGPLCRPAACCSVLVANNGLAAVKFMRSVRAWATQTLGHAKAILLVAMATPNDIRINAEHIQLSDQFVEVPGGSNNNNYANVSLIVQVCWAVGLQYSGARGSVEGWQTQRGSLVCGGRGLAGVAKTLSCKGGRWQIQQGEPTVTMVHDMCPPVVCLLQVAERAGVDAVWPGW